MGERGPKPAPTALKVVNGTRPSRVNKAEPKPTPAEGVQAPATLSEVALGIWQEVAPDLERKGVLTTWDRNCLAVFCEAMADHRGASALVAEQGVMVKTQRGYVKNPALQVKRDAAQVAMRAMGELGLTPSARSTLKMPEQQEEGARERLLS